MTIDQAIKKAIEGGWKMDASDRVSFDELVAITALKKEYLLDPSFWQSLGRALRWNEHTVVIKCPARDTTRVSPKGPITYHVPAHTRTRLVKNARWKKEWHRFIDHLAEGKDVETYFASLK